MNKRKLRKDDFHDNEIALDLSEKNQDSLNLIPQEIEEIRKNVLALTYEESLKELDLLISDLQDENLPITNLQNSYSKAKIYLEHCESLLDTLEQEIIQLEPENLTSTIFKE